MIETNTRQTPLHNAHIAQKARMVDFAGWSMPVLYTSILEESRAVRSSVGIFDISHMGRTRIAGAGATALLQKLTSNDVEALKPSEAQYSLLMNPHGGIVDDIIIYREGVEEYMVVINASNTQKDLKWIASHTPAGVTVTNNTDATAMIAVQGPSAPQIVSDMAGDSALLELSRFQFSNGNISGCPATLCRTGYTGEDGFEVIVPAESAETVWNDLISAGAVPCGLGARDTLRIEAGYPLYGHEIDDTTSPIEAGLSWVVQLEKGDFIGADAIRAVKQKGPARKLVGLVSKDRLQPRQGFAIYAGGEDVGIITSGAFSPTRNYSVAMGYIAAEHSKNGTQVEVEIRDKRIAATVVPKKNLLSA